MSPMSRTRCLGSFCRQHRRYTSIAGDSSAGRLDQSGSEPITAAMVSEEVFPANNRVPVSIS